MKRLCMILMFILLMSGCANHHDCVDWKDLQVYEKNGLSGYMDQDNNIIIKAHYDGAAPFCDGLALVLKQTNDHKEIWQYINVYGETPFEIDCYRADSFSEGYAAVKFEENGKWGYINPEGKLVIDAQYDLASMFKNGEATVHINGNSGKWVVINKEGDIVRELSEPENWESDVQGTPSKETEFLY